MVRQPAPAHRRHRAGSRRRQLGRTSVGGFRPLNNGIRRHRIEAARERKASADQIIARLRAKIADSARARRSSCSRRRTSTSAGGYRAPNTSTRCRTRIWTNSTNGRRSCWPRCKALPQLRDVATDQQTNSAMLSLTIDRDQAARFGIQPALIDQTLYDAFGQRQVTQYFTQLNSYHVVLEVPPETAGGPATLDKLYIKSPLTGQQVPLSTFVKYDTQHVAFLSINHQGQFPAVTLSFNLAPGVALGEAVDAIEKRGAAIRHAGERSSAPSRAPPRRSRPR